MLHATIVTLDPKSWLDRAAHAANAAQRESIIAVARALESLGMWKLVAEFHPLVACLLRLGETGLKRRFGAEMLHVVVGPGNRVGANPDRHDCSL